MPRELTPEQQEAISSFRIQTASAPVGRIRNPATGQAMEIGQIINRPGAPVDHIYETRLRAMRQRHAVLGVEPATVLNFLPIELSVNSPFGGVARVVIPACPIGQPYAAYTWANGAYIEPLATGEGSHVPQDTHPYQMAEAFCYEYRDMGGVVWFHGTLEEGDPLQRTDQNLPEKIAEAKANMLEWAKRAYYEAQSLWEDRGGALRGSINKIHITAAHLLLDVRFIDKMPPWANAERKPEDIAPICPGCGVEPKKGVPKCRECGFVLDPARALELHLIEEEDLSLERLTRAQVEALGISSFVAETADEREDRVRAGRPKPQSRFRMKPATPKEK